MITSTLEKKVRRFVASACDIQVVFFSLRGADEGVVMLAQKGQYATCTICPNRKILVSKNYLGDGQGILTAPMSPQGLVGLLQWTDRCTAKNRFQDLHHDVSYASAISTLPS